MTKKRWIVVAGLCACFFCAGFAGYSMLPPRPGVTKANFDLIEERMTLNQVEGLLGSKGIKVTKMMVIGNKTYGWIFYNWMGDGEARIEVCFFEDREGIRDKNWYGSTESIVDRFRRWLDL